MSTSLLSRRVARTLAALAAALMLVWMAAGPAAAHFQVNAVEPLGDGSVEVTLLLDHDCDAADTSELRLAVPEGVTADNPVGAPGWAGRVEGDEVIWVANRAEAGIDRLFTVELRMSGQVGQQFYLPTSQICSDGDGYEWDDTDPSGEEPAPSIVATENLLAEVVAPTAPAGEASSSEASGNVPLGGVLAGVGGVALVAAVAGLLVARRRSSS